MATISRIHNSRSLRMYPVQADRDDEIPAVLPGGTSTLYSNPMHGPKTIGQWSAQLIWTAGPSGAFTVQYCLKPYPELATDADWVTDTTVVVLGTSLTVAGAAGNAVIFAGNVLPEWIRIKWLATSGAASTVLGYSRVDGDRT